MMKISGSPWTALLIAITTLPICSCEKQRILFEEKAALESELQACQKIIQEYDAKFATLGQHAAYAIPAMEGLIATAEKENAAVALEVGGITSKVEALEQAVQTYRPKVEAFKALQLK